MSAALERQFGSVNPNTALLRSSNPINTFVSPFSREGKKTLPEEQLESIYESYDPLNEAKLLQRFPQMTTEEKDYYLQENIFSYLEEFVGKVPYKQLSGVLKEDGSLEMMGMSVMDMYRKTAELAGPGSREDYEWQGLSQIHQALQQGANRGVWISPPKLANYGFVFAVIAGDYDMNLKGRPLKELILRYDEKMGNTQKSKEIANSITDSLGFGRLAVQSTEDFLSSPLLYSHDTFDDVNHLLQVMKINPQTVERSQHMRETVFPQLQPLVQQYQEIMRQMNTLDLSNDTDPAVQLCSEQAKVLIGALFNGAKELMRDKDSAQKFEHLSGMNAQDLFAMATIMAKSEALVIQGGSNCPVAKGSTMSQVSDLTRAGFSFDNGLHIISLRDNPLDVFKKKEKWEFNKDGDCQKCKKNSKDVGQLGPCKVCEKCQHKFDTGEYS